MYGLVILQHIIHSGHHFSMKATEMRVDFCTMYIVFHHVTGYLWLNFLISCKQIPSKQCKKWAFSRFGVQVNHQKCGNIHANDVENYFLQFSFLDIRQTASIKNQNSEITIAVAVVIQRK